MEYDYTTEAGHRRPPMTPVADALNAAMVTNIGKRGVVIAAVAVTTLLTVGSIGFGKGPVGVAVVWSAVMAAEFFMLLSCLRLFVLVGSLYAYRRWATQ